MGFTAGPYPGDATLTLVCKILDRPPGVERAR
jgi:hypothetical protein